MKIPIWNIICLIFLIFSGVSCKETCGERDKGNIISYSLSLAPFSSVQSSVSAKVFIRKGAQQSVAIRIHEGLRNTLVTKVADNKLSIESSCTDPLLQQAEIRIVLPDIEFIGLSGSGIIELPDTLITNQLSLQVTGSGTLTGLVKSNELKSVLSGSGQLKLDGISAINEIRSSGSGNFFGFGLISLYSNVAISGSGRVETTTFNTLEALLSGSGNLYFKGFPEISSNISGTGLIINAN